MKIILPLIAVILMMSVGMNSVKVPEKEQIKDAFENPWLDYECEGGGCKG